MTRKQRHGLSMGASRRYEGREVGRGSGSVGIAAFEKEVHSFYKIMI